MPSSVATLPKEAQQAKLAGPIEFQVEDLPSVAIIEREWRSLEATAQPVFFTSWHWIGTLLTALPPANRPRLIRGSIDGKTVALALLGAKDIRRRRGLVRARGIYLNETGDPRFDSPMIEHNGLLAAASHRKAAGEALIAWFANQKIADELFIRGSLDRFPDGLVEGCGLIREEITVPSYSVGLSRLSASDGELIPVLSANARQQLRRAFRHFELAGPVRLDRAATISEAREFFAELKTLHIASWERRGKTHAFSNSFFESFHQLLIERSFGAGGAQLLRASAGNQVIGYLYNFCLGGHVYSYQSGFVYEDKYARPGAVAHALAIRDAYQSGAAIYDFLAGHNRLKKSFSTHCQPMLWQVIQQPRLAFRLERFARRVKRVVQRGGWQHKHVAVETTKR